MMFRLGLRLSLRAGREALIRLVLIASAVAVGVAVLLCVVADFHAYTTTTSRTCWECTQGSSLSKAAASASNVELWNYGTTYYQGRQIERLDVAVLGRHAPVVPGLSRMPGTGQYYVSPALATLLASAPRDELGGRFPGTQAGTIGDAALSSPDELVVIVGDPSKQLAGWGSTTLVNAISTKTAVHTTAAGYRYGFGLVAIALFIPLLVLIGVSTRLAAARREERYSAMRLVGATSYQIDAIASVDAVVGSLFGTLAGIGAFLLLRPAIAQVPVTGARYFPSVVTPTALGYAVTVIGVPVAAALGALWSLQRVRIDPMGAGRKATPSPPRAWGPIVLAIGLVLFIAFPGGSDDFTAVFVGLVMIMIGLVTGGSWLTMKAAGLAAKFVRGPSTLLATRRLADDPKGAARSISGLVLAIFIGTAIAGIVPPLISSQDHTGGGTLTSVLRVSFVSQSSEGLSAVAGAGLLNKLQTLPGVRVLPLYNLPPQDLPPLPPGAPAGAPPIRITCGDGGGCASVDSIVSCDELRQLSALGTCAAGTDVTAAFAQVLLGDNMLGIAKDLPVVNSTSRTRSFRLAGLSLGAALIQTNTSVTTEKVRTLLTPYTQQSGSIAPQTFGEVAKSRAVLYNELQRGALAVAAVTLLVSGCSLAVALAGGVIDRKRPFTLLRLTGTPVSVLYRVALLESAVPLAIAALVAAGTGLLVAMRVVEKLGTKNTSVAMPNYIYFLTVGIGLAASLAAILAALPLLKRLTNPDAAQFE
jgi:hypothetical protein